MTPKVLLFDLGGVLLENVGFERLNALLQEPMAEEALKTRWLASPAVRSFELGTCSPSAFASRFVDEWPVSIGATTFLDAFAAWPKGLYPGAADLLFELRKRYRVACLSNSNVIHWQRFDGFAAHFEIALSSHLLGRIKPDADCFQEALAACDAAPAETAFFDDSSVNVEAARALGIEAVHVNGLAELERSLVTRGWL